jgi:ParB family chromosome partitioning protein
MKRSADSGRLITVGLRDLLPHASNPNVMSEELIRKLTANIGREQDYPPLVVRPHPTREGKYQLLDGHQRYEALRRLGYSDARCYLWPCDDAEALTLVATLNRLRGQDQPVKRATLVGELAALLPEEDLSTLLPETRADVESALQMVQLDTDALLQELERSSEPYGGPEWRLLSFLVPAEDEQLVLKTIDGLAKSLTGPNRRGRALAELARHCDQRTRLDDSGEELI